MAECISTNTDVTSNEKGNGNQMSTHSKQQTKKATASGWIGSALEYYDFFIYATAASLVFPQIFFAKGDPNIAIIASLAWLASVSLGSPAADGVPPARHPAEVSGPGNPEHDASS